MILKELRFKAGMTIAEFAERFDIPKRTVENWEYGKNKCPAYVEKLLVEKLMEIIKENANMKKYELKKETREFIGYKNRKEIKPGCTLDQADLMPELIKSFDNKEDALEELKKYESSIDKGSCAAGTLYTVTEYYVDENEYDEDGQWICGGDIWEFSKMELEEEE